VIPEEEAYTLNTAERVFAANKLPIESSFVACSIQRQHIALAGDCGFFEPSPGLFCLLDFLTGRMKGVLRHKLCWQLIVGLTIHAKNLAHGSGVSN